MEAHETSHNKERDGRENHEFRSAGRREASGSGFDLKECKYLEVVVIERK